MNTLSSYTFPSLLTPSAPTPDASHLRDREAEVKAVPGGFIVRLVGGGHRWHQRVAPDHASMLALVCAFFDGTLDGGGVGPTTLKETP